MSQLTRLVALAALAAALVVGALVAPGIARAEDDPPPTAFVDQDHDGIDDAVEQQLADRFAPAILVEPDESNFPVNVEWFLGRAHLQYHEDCSGDDDEFVPGLGPGQSTIGTQANLLGPPWRHGSSWGSDHPDAHCGEDDSGDEHPPHRAITTIAADPDGQWSVEHGLVTGYSDQQTFVLPDLPLEAHEGSRDPRQWTSYFHAYPTADGGVMLQYWHLFAYNELSVNGFGRHGGDWDATIHVQLDRNLRSVEKVWFSRHGNDHPGDPIAPGDVTFVEGTHPLMTIDGGGHAAYSSPSDFCSHRSFAGGTAVWPSDPGDAENPAKLALIGCALPPPAHTTEFILTNPVGGAVWKTWEDGDVVAHVDRLPAESAHGPLVNLGEYNPCSASTCNGSRQASSLLAGQFHPLNDQVFIRFEGRWGDLPSCNLDICATPPRGPVFQGAEENDDTHEVVYRSWYNEGGDRPAAPDHTSWRVAPQPFWLPRGPSAFRGGIRVLGPNTTIGLAAVNTNGAAQAFGPSRVYYRLYRTGSTPPAFTLASGDATLPASDGEYTLDLYAMDALDNQSETETAQLARDGTPPTTSWSATGPQAHVGDAWALGGSATISLAATDAALPDDITTFYRVYPRGSAPPGYREYDEPFALPATDGVYVLDFTSEDAVANHEPTQSVTLIRDTTPPATTSSLDGPTATSGGMTYVAGSTKVELAASDGDDPGAVTTRYRVYPAGGPAPAFAEYTGPFPLSGPDGAYRVDFASVDALGNEEPAHSLELTLDTTPPAASSSLAGPTATSGGVTYLGGAATVALAATDSTPGAVRVSYRVTPAGGSPAAFADYAAPFSLPAPDGGYVVEFTATDALGNESAPQSLALTRDTTAPAIEIASPEARDYAHSETLTLGYDVSDGGSGVASMQPTLDGQASLAGHGLGSGQAIDLLTELALGQHSFAVAATDAVGNTANAAVPFTLVVTAASIGDDVTELVASGAVDANRATSLGAKLAAAAAARDAGDCKTAAGAYGAFVHEVQAQAGKKISEAAAAILVADAEYLLAHCP